MDSISVHILVLNTFVGKKPEDKFCCNHKDGNKLNNSVDNLEWVTFKENMQHAFSTGLCENSIEAVRKMMKEKSGENNYTAKLTNEKVKEIAFLIKSGVKIKEIANKFKVSSENISSIKKGKTWKCLDRYTKDLSELKFVQNNKLSEEDVLHIRKLLREGIQEKAIRLKYKVSRGCIQGIKHGKTWKYLK